MITLNAAGGKCSKGCSGGLCGRPGVELEVLNHMLRRRHPQAPNGALYNSPGQHPRRAKNNDWSAEGAAWTRRPRRLDAQDKIFGDLPEAMLQAVTFRTFGAQRN